MEVVIADSARKRAISDDDMLHAYRNPIHVFDVDDGMTMITGPDRAARLLEVGFVVSFDGVAVIVHAMPARAKFLRNR